MCGVIYHKGKNAKKSVYEQFMSQRTRGLDGFGYVTIKNGRINHIKHFINEGETIWQLARERDNEIMFHHRIPTSTLNSLKTNHPIETLGGSYEHCYILIHNGMILNAEELKTKHDKLGIIYSTLETQAGLGHYAVDADNVSRWRRDPEAVFNDSECLLHELALYMDGIQTNIEAKGSIAFVLIQATLDGMVESISYGHNFSSPLLIHRTADTLSISSEQVDGVEVPINHLFKIDYATGELFDTALTFPNYSYVAKKSTGFVDARGQYADDYLDDYSAYGVGGGDINGLNYFETYSIKELNRLLTSNFNERKVMRRKGATDVDLAIIEDDIDLIKEAIKNKAKHGVQALSKLELAG